MAGIIVSFFSLHRLCDILADFVTFSQIFVLIKYLFSEQFPKAFFIYVFTFLFYTFFYWYFYLLFQHQLNFNISLILAGCCVFFSLFEQKYVIEKAIGGRFFSLLLFLVCWCFLKCIQTDRIASYKIPIEIGREKQYERVIYQIEHEIRINEYTYVDSVVLRQSLNFSFRIVLFVSRSLSHSRIFVRCFVALFTLTHIVHFGGLFGWLHLTVSLIFFFLNLCIRTDTCKQNDKKSSRLRKSVTDFVFYCVHLLRARERERERARGASNIQYKYGIFSRPESVISTIATTKKKHTLHTMKTQYTNLDYCYYNFVVCLQTILFYCHDYDNMVASTSCSQFSLLCLPPRLFSFISFDWDVFSSDVSALFNWNAYWCEKWSPAKLNDIAHWVCVCEWVRTARTCTTSIALTYYTFCN